MGKAPGVAATELAEVGAELCGGVAEGSEELGLHVEHGHARGVAGEVYGSDDASAGGVDGDGDGAQAYFQFLVDNCVAQAADVAESEAELFYRDDGACGVGGEDGAGEERLQLLWWQVSEQDAAHGGAVRGEPGADVQVDGHDTGGDVGAGDVDDFIAVQRGDGEGFTKGLGHALEDGLGGCREGRRGGVGVGERKHAGAEGVALAIFRAGEAELGEGVKAASDGGAREASFDRKLRDGHVGRGLGESLDDDKAAGERGHEVWVALVDVECGGGGDAGFFRGFLGWHGDLLRVCAIDGLLQR